MNKLKNLIKKKPAIVFVPVIIILGAIIGINLVAPASIIKTGEGAMPEVSIKHISTFEFDEFFVTFNVTVTDADNDIVLVDIQAKAPSATRPIDVTDYGTTYNITEWTSILTFTDPVSPLVKTVQLTFYEEISFEIRVVVDDLGGNSVYDSIKGNVDIDRPTIVNASIIAIPIGLIALVMIQRVKTRKNKN